MTSTFLDTDGINVKLSQQEALILFEWLSRNWEKTSWENEDFFANPAEKQLLIWLENDLVCTLGNAFDREYRTLVESAYRTLVPDKENWK